MMHSYKLLVVSISAPVLSFLAFMYWYQWGAKALTPSEINTYMATINEQTQSPGARHNLPALRKFLEEDDGKPFYTINMYKYHKMANYPLNSGFSGTGKEAYGRFSSVMVPLMMRRGSHPVYGSSWVDKANGKWDRIVIVKYRSRRDLADLFATDAFADASLHKWASLQKHDRMLVQAQHIPDGLYIMLLIAASLGGIIYGSGQYLLRRHNSSNRY